MRIGSSSWAAPSHGFALCVVLLFNGFSALSATVWNGPIITFTQTSSDWTAPLNQDRLTDNVWITRAASEGVFNAVTETNFTHSFSPADTEWANGQLTDYTNLTYTDWNTWAKGVNPNPPSTVGVPAVLHLKTDDAYIGITFTSWGTLSGTFAYQRTTRILPPRIPLAITRIGNNVVVTWTNAVFKLQASPTATGTYTNIAGASSPFTNSFGGQQLYFRLRFF
jgi:hypothetical protein